MRSSFANPSGSHRAARAARQLIDGPATAWPRPSGPAPVRSCSPAGARGGQPRRARRPPAALGWSWPVPSSTLPSPSPSPPWVAPPSPSTSGVVDVDALADRLVALRAAGEVALVSVMAVNNEVGTIQPVEAVAPAVHEHAAGALLHTDAVQAAPWSTSPPVEPPTT